jgi:hypothetical protein
MDKYAIMFRETILRYLRNLNRQRRGYKRFYDDINILIGEANFTDDHVSQLKG